MANKLLKSCPIFFFNYKICSLLGHMIFWLMGFFSLFFEKRVNENLRGLGIGVFFFLRK